MKRLLLLAAVLVAASVCKNAFFAHQRLLKHGSVCKTAIFAHGFLSGLAEADGVTGGKGDADGEGVELLQGGKLDGVTL